MLFPEPDLPVTMMMGDFFIRMVALIDMHVNFFVIQRICKIDDPSKVFFQANVIRPTVAFREGSDKVSDPGPFGKNLPSFGLILLKPKDRIGSNPEIYAIFILLFEFTADF